MIQELPGELLKQSLDPKLEIEKLAEEPWQLAPDHVAKASMVSSRDVI